MKKFDEWFLPDGEEHLPMIMQAVPRKVDGRHTYQYHKYEAALRYTRDRVLAVDVGAHVGLWSYFMAKDFEHVAAFEPMAAHARCWYANMNGVHNAELFESALGEAPGTVNIATRTQGSSGDTGVIAGSEGNIPMMTLDSLDLQNLSLIKIDCEGFEEFVLRGGQKTLSKCKPVVIVEQKGLMSLQYGLTEKSAVEYLETLGAQFRTEIAGDYILSWDH